MVSEVLKGMADVVGTLNKGDFIVSNTIRRRIVLLDAMPLLYSAHFSLKMLSNQETGEKTGARFGFLRSIQNTIKRFQPEKFVVCWDVQGKINKASENASYKSNRKWSEDKQELYDQIPSMKAILKQTRLTQVEKPGYEADDLIGSLTRKSLDQGWFVIISSLDDDLLQLASLDCVRYWPRKKKDTKALPELFGPAEVRDKFQVLPQALLVWRAIVGDKSDSIKGVASGKIVEGIQRCFNVAVEKLAAKTYHVGPGLEGQISLLHHVLQAMNDGSAAGVKIIGGNLSMVENNLSLMYLHDPETHTYLSLPGSTVSH